MLTFHFILVKISINTTLTKFVYRAVLSSDRVAKCSNLTKDLPVASKRNTIAVTDSICTRYSVKYRQPSMYGRHRQSIWDDRGRLLNRSSYWSYAPRGNFSCVLFQEKSTKKQKISLNFFNPILKFFIPIILNFLNFLLSIFLIFFRYFFISNYLFYSNFSDSLVFYFLFKKFFNYFIRINK